MKTSVRFDRAVSALVGAYLNDTLDATDCKSCAVGNIVAAAYGTKVRRNTEGYLTCDAPNNKWAAIFIVGRYERDPKSDHRYETGLENIAKTGFSTEELRRIEHAFMFPGEYGYNLKMDEHDDYKRLMSCVDVLCQIEGISDPAPYKAQFDKSLPLELV